MNKLMEQESQDPGLTRWTRLLNKVDKDPDSALKDPRCQTPHFLARYFDLCDGKVLEAPHVARDYTRVAVELAKRTGDRHQINRAAGVAIHGSSATGSGSWPPRSSRLTNDGLWIVVRAAPAIGCGAMATC